jgi:hypothetical protein
VRSPFNPLVNLTRTSVAQRASEAASADHALAARSTMLLRARYRERFDCAKTSAMSNLTLQITYKPFSVSG